MSTTFFRLDDSYYFEPTLWTDSGNQFEAPVHWTANDGSVFDKFPHLTVRFMKRPVPFPDLVDWGPLTFMSEPLRRIILDTGAYDIEFLPVDLQDRFKTPISDAKLWLFHRIKMRDCIDKKASDIELWDDRPPLLIKKVTSLVFDEEKVGATCVFVPVGLPFVFCTDKLAKIIGQQDLRVHLTPVSEFRLGC